MGRHDDETGRHRRHRPPFGAAWPPDGEKERREERRRGEGKSHQRRLERIDIGDDEENGGGKRGRGDGGPGGDNPRQSLVAIEGTVEILGETRREREEVRR